MEQVGYRTAVFECDGVAGHQRDYMAWLLAACAEDGVKVADVIDADALDLLAQKLRTPLQAAEQRSQRDQNAPGAGLRGGVPRRRQAGAGRDCGRRTQPCHRRPGPRLIRNGYDAATLAREFGAKLAEIRTFLAGTLGADRTRELTDQMRAAGVPL